MGNLNRMLQNIYQVVVVKNVEKYILQQLMNLLKMQKIFMVIHMIIQKLFMIKQY